MNKKGISEVLATVILIGITIGVVSLVWVVVNSLVHKNIQSSQACLGISDKVQLNPAYTCYNNSGSANELWFSINVGDISTIKDILVSITGGGGSVSFKIIGDNPAQLQYFNRTKPTNMSLPGKNEGLSYIYTLPASFPAPTKIEIAPIINGEMCGGIVPINQFDSCSSLA